MAMHARVPIPCQVQVRVKRPTTQATLIRSADEEATACKERCQSASSCHLRGAAVDAQPLAHVARVLRQLGLGHRCRRVRRRRRALAIRRRRSVGGRESSALSRSAVR